MQSVWLLVSTCIVPIITYASETWHTTKQEEKKLNQLLDKIPIYQTKAIVRKAISNKYRMKLEQSAQGKSKIEYYMEAKNNWQPEKRAQYMNELTRKQTSLIFKARTRMLKVKSNYKNGHPNLTCRMCKTEEETQTHILEECPVVHPDETNKIPKHQLFSEDTGTLREIAIKIGKIQEKLDEVVC